ncbi:hypothetical protein NEFER03_0992 [Nematocida sp. LUAm3]|nr:hypothetical protein NEFER03_0992 [Nematocida sp. LUAm3]KAI5175404.1 hypothetical protein NEFER02_1333 [Nematocida sp. LUAm2]KAI5177639.1 hypothetical protein NEFER01_0863 [Nematocida sp. LUAm1]
MFNAEAHFLSKYKNSAPLREGSLNLWLGNSSYQHKKKSKDRSEKMTYTNISYDIAIQLNELFSEHFNRVIHSSSSVPILSIISRMELLGAYIIPVPHKNPEDISDIVKQNQSPHTRGILINETKNTMAIYTRGLVKIFPKAMHNYIIWADNEPYFLIGSNLRCDRKYGK